MASLLVYGKPQRYWDTHADESELMERWKVVRGQAAHALRSEADKRACYGGDHAAYNMYTDSGEEAMGGMLGCFFNQASISHLLHVASKSSASELLVFDCHMGLLCTLPDHMLLLFRNPDPDSGLDVVGIDTATTKVCLMRRGLLKHAIQDAYSGAYDATDASAIADSPINVVLTKEAITGKSFGERQLDSMKSAVMADANKHLLCNVTPHTLKALVTTTCGYSADNAHRLVNTLDQYGRLDGLRAAMLHVTLEGSEWDLLCLVMAGDGDGGVLKCLDGSGHICMYLPSVTSKSGSLYSEAVVDGKEFYRNRSFMGLIGQTQRTNKETGKKSLEKRVIVVSGKAFAAKDSSGKLLGTVSLNDKKRRRGDEGMVYPPGTTTVESSFHFSTATPEHAKLYLTLTPCAVPAKLAGSNGIHAALFGVQQ